MSLAPSPPISAVKKLVGFFSRCLGSSLTCLIKTLLAAPQHETPQHMKTMGVIYVGHVLPQQLFVCIYML